MRERVPFIQRLNARYQGEFELERNVGHPPCDHAIFSAKNKRFGSVKISGDFDEWRDEEDYYAEDENGVYDDAETCGFTLSVLNIGKAYLVSPTQAFEMLDKIFADQMLCYVTLPMKNSRLYEIEEFKGLLRAGKVRRKKTYRFWSGDRPLPEE